MDKEIKLRPGFETAKVMHSAEEWEEDERGYWLSKTPQERLEAMTKIIHQHIWMMGLPTEMDKTKVELLNATR